jgi:ADP-heptose:LPS heptosyltransferase
MKLNSIERAWRSAWMRIIALLLPAARTTSLGDVRTRNIKVLFLRYERIGDMIMATGLIRALARSSDTVTLDVVAAPTTTQVLERNPHVRKVHVLDRASWRSYFSLARFLRREKYDVIVDGRINNPPVFTSTPLLMLGAGSPIRIGVGGGNNDLIYNVRVKPYDRRTPYIEGSKALAVPFGVDVAATDWRPEIFLSNEERDSAQFVWARAAARVNGTETPVGNNRLHPRFLVNLSASEPNRRWDDRNFVSVLRSVSERHPMIPIVVMGLPDEWESVRRVAESVNGEAAATPTLRIALALVATSDRILTPDTSISHAASAFNKPAVVLLRRDCYPYAPWELAGACIFWDGPTIASLMPSEVVQPTLALLNDEENQRTFAYRATSLKSRVAG